MNNLTHAEKLRKAAILRHGSEEAWREWMRENQKKSQQTIKEKNIHLGFAAMDKDKLKEISRMGGLKSRPGGKKDETIQS